MILTNLIVVQVWVLDFEKWMVMLAVKNESIRRPSYLSLLGILDSRVTSSWNNFGVPIIMTGRHDLNYPTIRVFEDSHWRLDEVSRYETV